MKPVLRKSLKWTALSLAVLVLIAGAATSWLLFTTSGARWIAGVVTSRFAPQVRYAGIDGTIAGTLSVRDFQFQGPPESAGIRIADLRVEPTLRMLLSRRLRIENARVSGLVVTLPEQPAPEKSVDESKPMWVEPPLDIVVDDFQLLDGRIVRGRETLFTLKQLEVAARWSRTELVIDRLSLLPGDIAGTLDVEGKLVPSGRLVHGDLDARWKDVRIPASYLGRELASQGALRFEGTPEAYAAKGAFEIGPPGDPTRVTLDLSGTDARADIRQLRLVQRAGELSVNGGLEFEPVVWTAAVRARKFDPGELLPDWHGEVDLEANTHGRLEEAGPRGSIELVRLDGTLRGLPIAGEGDIDFAAPSRLAGELRVRSGRSRIEVRGASDSGNDIDARVTLAVASLADWVPDSSGSLTGEFRVRGRWPDITVAGGATGRSLAYLENRIGRLQVDATVKSPLNPDGRVQARAARVSAAGLEFARVELNATGNQARHRVAASAEGERLSASVEVSGSLGEGAALDWRGSIESLMLDTPDLEPLRLRDPAKVAYAGGGFSIENSCLVQADSSLCVAASLAADGSLTARYEFARVPLNLANAFAPETLPGELRGELAGQGNIRRGADGQWFGEASVQSASAQVVLRDDEPGKSALGQRTLQIYENLNLRASLLGTRATADLRAGLQNGGSLKATVAVADLTGDTPRLEGRIDAGIPTLAPFGSFAPRIGNLDGQVDARIVIGGTLAAPEFTGHVDAKKLQADLGELGIELRDGRLEGHARPGGGFSLAGSVASGKGHIELAGTMSERGDIQARVRGQNFQAADIPAANVLVTPNLELTGDPKRYVLAGELTIPRADINLQKLPKDKSPNVSPDVVVIRDGKVVESTAEAEALPLAANIKVVLGEDINITGYGLEASVDGELQVRESPGEPTTGSGQLRVSGTYQAYGQDLTIREGRLLYAGTPIDNPRLAIVAMRRIDDDLETGLRIAGSAQRPVITVISDPDVGEADALSYLVTGRSLSEVGSASGSSQDTLASASRSLQGAGTGLVAKRIGQRLGLDEAGVEENEMIGGSALTIGEYLSPRLYLSYGVGLFEPGEVIALRYKLSKDVGVRIQRGTEETRAGVEYRIEK